MANLFRLFPFQIALGTLLFYGLTLSHGVTVDSLSLTAKIAGWDWVPMAGHPLLWLLTLPVRLLPGAWAPVALNLFSAGCAAVTLGILARSLELLPWSRPLATLQGWSQRLPLLLAVAVCGLEFNFWQDAAALTGEMLDLLLLATAVWCLLEYRLGNNIRWLHAAAFAWGAGMTENWLMQMTLPLFIGGLVWLRRRCFLVEPRLEIRFFLQMTGFGLAGFSIYALLPLANGLGPGSPWSESQSWIISLKETNNMLAGIYGGFWMRNRLVTFAALLFFLVPLLGVFMRAGLRIRKTSPLWT